MDNVDMHLGRTQHNNGIVVQVMLRSAFDFPNLGGKIVAYCDIGIGIGIAAHNKEEELCYGTERIVPRWHRLRHEKMPCAKGGVQK